jgi:hypothetical protein
MRTRPGRMCCLSLRTKQRLRQAKGNVLLGDGDEAGLDRDRWHRIVGHSVGRLCGVVGQLVIWVWVGGITQHVCVVCGGMSLCDINFPQEIPPSPLTEGPPATPPLLLAPYSTLRICPGACGHPAARMEPVLVRVVISPSDKRPRQFGPTPRPKHARIARTMLLACLLGAEAAAQRPRYQVQRSCPRRYRSAQAQQRACGAHS